MSSQATVRETPVFQLKGGLYTLTALQLQSNELSLFAEQLDHKIQQAPKFFHNAPVVIDLQKIGGQGLKLDFKQLKEILISRHLVPVGVKGGNTEQHTAATTVGLAILSDGGKDREQQASDTLSVTRPESSNSDSLETSEASDVQGSNTRVITEPVRSGQQIYARGGDLIVLAPVSHGAELLADGHIHVYGPLRGRALAGVTGDEKAHIFCQSLEAELISIAGNYKISEDIERLAWQVAVNIYLKDGRLQIAAL